MYDNNFAKEQLSNTHLSIGAVIAAATPVLQGVLYRSVEGEAEGHFADTCTG